MIIHVNHSKKILFMLDNYFFWKFYLTLYTTHFCTNKIYLTEETKIFFMINIKRQMINTALSLQVSCNVSFCSLSRINLETISSYRRCKRTARIISIKRKILSFVRCLQFATFALSNVTEISHQTFW